jgi:DNA topoisomerase-1
MIVERRSKKGRVFYGCANYPRCDFVSWDRVVPERCPACGGVVVAKIRRGGVLTLECRTDKTHDVSSIPAELQPTQEVTAAPVAS